VSYFACSILVALVVFLKGPILPKCLVGSYVFEACYFAIMNVLAAILLVDRKLTTTDNFG
jgi:hypothetical protein